MWFRYLGTDNKPNENASKALDECTLCGQERTTGIREELVLGTLQGYNTDTEEIDSDIFYGCRKIKSLNYCICKPQERTNRKRWMDRFECA